MYWPTDPKKLPDLIDFFVAKIFQLDSNINLTVPLKTADRLERELNALTTAIQEAAWNSILVIKTKLKGLNIPKEIRNCIAVKRKLRRNGISQEIHMIKIS
jgi:hypothetical protein